ncbi:thioesterase [Campylobacterota bacterium]|nr:thioesterase [Campylobacterota bacterium]
MRQKYFKSNPDDPAPLKKAIVRGVRFDELDPLTIMWHGHYASFFEEARVALGNHYGIGYLDFSDNGVFIPIRSFHADYFIPLTFGKTYTVQASLHFNEAARLDYEFHIYDDMHNLTSQGYTIHLMIDKSNNVLLAKPKFYEDFCNRWLAGEIE